MRTEPRRILLLRPSALGDVCRTTPVLASLRARWPQAQIDWLVQDSFADAIRCHPALDSVVLFRRDGFRGSWRPSAAAAIFAWLRDLGRRGYDVVFDLQGLGRSGLFSLCTRAPWRVGFRDARELGWLGANVHVERGGRRHTVDQMLHMVETQGVAAVPDLRLHSPPEAIESWSVLRRDLHLTGSYAVLAPTSRWRCKQWPAERWAQLAARALGELEVERVVVVGAPGEEAQTRWARSVEGCIDLCGRLRVGETMAVIRDARVLVANDSAPLHMAVGLGVPYVGLFGPTDPERVGPYRGDRWVVRAPWNGDAPPRSYRAMGDDDRLMRRIDVEEVHRLMVAAVSQPEWFARVAAGRAEGDRS